MIVKRVEVPNNSILKRKGVSFDYVDSFQCLIYTNDRHVDITKVLALFLQSGPKWADHLLVLRDKIVGLFGLKTTKSLVRSKGQSEGAKYQIGESLGMFKLFDKSDNEFVLGENDKHLDFRVSLFLESLDYETDKMRLSITTAVKFNNNLGRVYFFPVKPIHKILVRTMLKDIKQKLEENPSKTIG
jgi:hypothetical protein